MTDRYAVVGNPIKHSKSPLIHDAFARQTGEDILYTAMLAEPDGFDKAITQFFEHGEGCGLNVTLPFKEVAWQRVDERTERAQCAGAVNTIKKLDDGRLLGDNTDGAGLVQDLLNNDVTLADARILVLGAGGAVRGVLQPLLAQQPKQVVIANRTHSKAEALAADFAAISSSSYSSSNCSNGGGGIISACEQTQLEGQFDLIINGTSASLSDELPPISGDIVAADTVAYDMMYGSDITVFNQWALMQGASRAIDGLGMLVGQAAESFRLWRGVMPETAAVIQELRLERRR